MTGFTPTAKRPGANHLTQAVYYKTGGRIFDEFQEWAGARGAVGFQLKKLQNGEARYIAIFSTPINPATK